MLPEFCSRQDMAGHLGFPDVRLCPHRSREHPCAVLDRSAVPVLMEELCDRSCPLGEDWTAVVRNHGCGCHSNGSLYAYLPALLVRHFHSLHWSGVQGCGNTVDCCCSQ
eukprot:GHVL01017820.1.p2 GENE.GHVL01017820.1~~GHVL01017820.1.p2  ORF type:complete len:109 (+),score=3.77 GHVL01017820.1:838-1164(+)